VAAGCPQSFWERAYDRERGNLTAPEQAAESVVRHQIQETSLSALTTTAARRRPNKTLKTPEALEAQ
jgi:hypothetical protein